MGRSGEALRLAVVLLLSLTALASESNGNEEGPDGDSFLTENVLPVLYQQAESKCPNIRETFDQNAFKEAESCMLSKLQTPAIGRIVEEAQKRGQEEENEAIFRLVCDKRSEFQECARPIKQTIQRCFPQGETVVEAIDKLEQFLCDNQRRILIVTGKGSKCYSEREDRFDSCLSDYLLSMPKTLGDICKFLPDVGDCMRRTFSQCEEPQLGPDLIQNLTTSLKCPSGSSDGDFGSDETDLTHGKNNDKGKNKDQENDKDKNKDKNKGKNKDQENDKGKNKDKNKDVGSTESVRTNNTGSDRGSGAVHPYLCHGWYMLPILIFVQNHLFMWF